MKVVIFNVKYSANLGDGVIAECLEHALAKGTGWQIVGLDLAGRTHWAAPRQGKGRARLLKVLKALPGPIRDALVSLVLGRHIRRALAPAWRSALSDADFAVIGGGQLFQDGDLNFPLKLAGASGACEALEVPFAVFAVGAGPQHSSQGTGLFRALLGSRLLRHVAVRDERSRERFTALGIGADIALDPGLLAASVWPAVRQAATRSGSRPRHIGLGITHASVLAYHASPGAGAVGASDAVAQRFAALVRALIEDGHRVTCFTNGAGEDEEALRQVADILNAQGIGGERLQFQARAENPGALARFVANCDLIISHRLHASILAYAYAVPSIGLAWDDKVRGFYELIAEPERVLAFGEAAPEVAVALVRSTLAAGVEPSRHGVVLEMAGRGIDQLRSVISETVAAGRHERVGVEAETVEAVRLVTPALN